jgi:hypothetical protein
MKDGSEVVLQLLANNLVFVPQRHQNGDPWLARLRQFRVAWLHKRLTAEQKR